MLINSVQTIPAVVGIALFLAACVYDCAFRLVPNTIPAAIAISGIVLRIRAGDLGQGLLAGFLVFFLAALCWRRGWLGGADVKLFGAGALLCAPRLATGFVLATCLAGGGLALLYLLLGRLVDRPAPLPNGASMLRRIARIEQRRLHRRGPLPYATAIAFGAILTIVGK